ncbi:GNAT family N-acetyltransferase [Deinococcus petrolearius]|uniref:GNAT family N-acetyltransferase n=1 Tax=Deinococcus petrolearius TaxID=1751295 RepID=A0ABW1DL54_9DEIO
MALLVSPPLTPDLGALLARAMFPDPERVRRELAAYRSGAGGQVFAWEVGGEVVSAAGLRLEAEGRNAEVRHLGTAPAHTGRGHGRALLSAAAGVLGVRTLWAETDDGAVGFYRRAGFAVSAAPSPWGVNRYLCRLTLAPAAP